MSMPEAAAPTLTRIPISRPWMDEREAEAAQRPIRNGWVTQGPEVAAFEREFAAYVGAAHACAVSNCTAALHLALLAVGIRPGDEVITVSHSFIATANSVTYCGAIPVFVDIDSATLNIDPRNIEARITERTRAILCVHQMGMPCDLREILAIARRHVLPVIEDAACAIGSEIRTEAGWEKIGKPHGDIACFSFHPRKLLTTGDGGMLTTRNAVYDAKFRLWRQHGMSVPDSVRHSANDVIFENYDEVGYNYRLTDVQAAIGREQLKKLPSMVSVRRSIAARYRELLANVPGVCSPAEPNWARTNWQSYCVRLPRSCDQRSVMRKMLEDGIATRRGIMCAHRESAYAGVTREPLPESESAQDGCILLPILHGLSEADQDRIVDALGRAVAGS
jgi:perosamine synthetase